MLRRLLMETFLASNMKRKTLEQPEILLTSYKSILNQNFLLMLCNIIILLISVLCIFNFCLKTIMFQFELYSFGNGKIERNGRPNIEYIFQDTDRVCGRL